jgi:HlyD family secretion protein
MKRWVRRIGIVLGLAILILVLRLTVFRPEPVPVSVVEVARGRVEATVVNSRAGTVESRLRAQMSPGIAGLVSAIPVEKGQWVRKGQVLLRIDDAEYTANVLLAQRSLEAAQSSAQQACLAAEQAERDVRRSADLLERNLTSTQEHEKAQTNAETNAAACHAAEARMLQAEASLSSAKAILAKTIIRAPFSGVVLDVTTEVGEWISPSPPGVFIPPVLDVIDPAALYVEAPIDEADVERIRVGQPVRITLDAFKDREFAGTLSYVASFVTTQQEQNRTLPVEAVFEEQQLPENLLPGLSADIEVILEAREDALRVPAYALLEGDRVFVVSEGELKSVPVTTGLRNWEFVEILDGLTAGDQVVTSLDRPEVREGARVIAESDEGE